MGFCDTETFSSSHIKQTWDRRTTMFVYLQNNPRQVKICKHLLSDQLCFVIQWEQIRGIVFKWTFTLFSVSQTIIGIFCISRDIDIPSITMLIHSGMTLFSIHMVTLFPGPSKGSWEMCLWLSHTVRYIWLKIPYREPLCGAQGILSGYFSLFLNMWALPEITFHF